MVGEPPRVLPLPERHAELLLALDELLQVRLAHLHAPERRPDWQLGRVISSPNKPPQEAARPPRQFERATSGVTNVPLIGQLSNRQFHTELDRLVDVLDADVPVQERAALCQCGCGREVVARRKFVSQVHYNLWLSRERFVGPHLRR
jgi:hypothetical protein